MALDMDATRCGARHRSPTTLGLSAADTAGGIHELVNQNMAAASRMHAVEQGVDLRGVTMIAFGGAGPVHACGVAELLESPAVIFPVNASVLSAFGTLVTPVRIDLGSQHGAPDGHRCPRPSATRCSTSCATRAGGCSPRPVSPTAASGSATASMPATSARATRSRSGSARATSGPSATTRSSQRFEEDYRRIYGLTIPDVGVEAVTWRLSAFAEASPVEPMAQVGRRRRRRPHSTPPGAVQPRHRPVDTPVYRRPTSASASASTARRSSRSARPRRSSAPAGRPRSPPTDR